MYIIFSYVVFWELISKYIIVDFQIFRQSNTLPDELIQLTSVLCSAKSGSNFSNLPHIIMQHD